MTRSNSGTSSWLALILARDVGEGVGMILVFYLFWTSSDGEVAATDGDFELFLTDWLLSCFLVGLDYRIYFVTKFEVYLRLFCSTN